LRSCAYDECSDSRSSRLWYWRHGSLPWHHEYGICHDHRGRASYLSWLRRPNLGHWHSVSNGPLVLTSRVLIHDKVWAQSLVELSRVALPHGDGPSTSTFVLELSPPRYSSFCSRHSALDLVSALSHELKRSTLPALSLLPELSRV